MEITQRYTLEEFVDKHADALEAINAWIQRVEEAQWKCHNDIKRDFPSADYVKNSRYVFNIKGNNYRIIVLIVFFANECNIRFVGTHAEYDKINASKI